jgi:hypothetical protein
MAEKKVTNQAAIDAARRAEAERPAKLAEQKAKLPVVKEALTTAQVGARGTTGQTIFEKALAGLPAGLDAGAARGLAAMSARYGLQGAAANAYTGENIGYNISEQTKAEQGAVTNTENLINLYGTPVNIPGAIYEDSSTADDAEKLRRAGQSAYDILLAEFNQYGLGALVEPLKALIVSGPSSAELTLALRATDAYKKRFSANTDRIAKGLTALNEREYLGMEDQYQNIMRNYGLPNTYYAKDSMGTQAGFNQLLANDVSAEELEDRVMTAQSRVMNANPEIKQALRQFYPDITEGDMLAYALDPGKALTDIKRKVTAAEIGGAAIGAGLKTTQTAAEGLAAYGITKAQAQQGYGAIAEFLPTGEKLSEIYQESPYTQQQAEQEIFSLADSANAAKKRKRLSQLEAGSFSGSSGVGSGALSRDRATNNQTFGAGAY